MPASSTALELLSPARTADIGIEAIRHGADAVYIGGPAFGARAAAGNSLSDIARLCEYAHRFRGRIMMTLNTILTDDQLEDARRLAWDAWNAGVDALIVQDMGLLSCDMPPIQLHASTQCDIRTPEKARFLEAAGFTQIVPARELTLSEIRAIADVLTKARIEFFAHGALCVSYSGQCYASEALRCRSANRGECAQICRLAFDAALEDGTVLARKSHLLSLKDNDQSGNIAELVAAGVRSFKIEGRLKDLAYVKNLTAYYRKKIDDFIEKNPGYAQESIGRTSISFEPDPAKVFNRGATDYFVHGRQPDIAALQTPKNAGVSAGTVTKVTARSIFIRTRTPLHNADGITWFDEHEELHGMQINRAEPAVRGVQEVFPRTVPRDLAPGTAVMRNRDQVWDKLMASDTAERKIPLSVKAVSDRKGFSIVFADPEGLSAEIREEIPFQPASDPEKGRTAIRNALSKLGNTDFSLGNFELEGEVPFIPVSVLNRLRREAVSRLDEARAAAFSRWERTAPDPEARFPLSEMDYRANVMNEKAREFYEKHGCRITEPAYEAGKRTGKTELMLCRHCIRYTLGLCPKEAKKRGEKVRPLPIVLTSGTIRLTAEFHCKACEMSVSGERIFKR